MKKSTLVIAILTTLLFSFLTSCSGRKRNPTRKHQHQPTVSLQPSGNSDTAFENPLKIKRGNEDSVEIIQVTYNDSNFFKVTRIGVCEGCPTLPGHSMNLDLTLKVKKNFQEDTLFDLIDLRLATVFPYGGTIDTFPLGTDRRGHYESMKILYSKMLKVLKELKTEKVGAVVYASEPEGILHIKSLYSLKGQKITLWELRQDGKGLYSDHYD